MKQLYKAFEQLNIDAGQETILKFREFMGLVLEWNKKVNLTAITDENNFINKHFVDSVLCAGFDEVQAARTIIDVGTGAGFPGVPLALVFPDKEFLLIDSTGKKVKILSEIIRELALSNITTLHARAEELARTEQYREKFDLCVSRAVADLAALSEYCLPFVKPGGYFISYKGPDAEKEFESAAKAIKILGGEACGIRKASLEGFDLDHNMVVISKIIKTPEIYPGNKVSRETSK